MFHLTQILVPIIVGGEQRHSDDSIRGGLCDIARQLIMIRSYQSWPQPRLAPRLWCRPPAPPGPNCAGGSCCAGSGPSSSPVLSSLEPLSCGFW